MAGSEGAQCESHKLDYKTLDCYQVNDHQRQLEDLDESKEWEVDWEEGADALGLLEFLVEAFEANNWFEVGFLISCFHNTIARVDHLEDEVEEFLVESGCLCQLGQCASDCENTVFIKSLAVVGRLFECSSIVVKVMWDGEFFETILSLFVSREWSERLSIVFMRLFAGMCGSGPAHRVGVVATPVFGFSLCAVSTSESGRLVVASLEFLGSFFHYPIVPKVFVRECELDAGCRGAVCEALRPCFERFWVMDDDETCESIGRALFRCVMNMEFWGEKFETPMRAGLHLFFMSIFLSNPEPMFSKPEWLNSMMVFERYCFVLGGSEFVEMMMREIPVIVLGYLVVDDEGAPAEVRSIHVGLESRRDVYDEMRGHVCAMLTRLIVLRDDFLSELNSRHFFAGLLLGIEDRTSGFKFEGMFLLAVGFQRLGVSEVGDFLTIGFVELTEAIGLSIRLVDGRDLSSEMARVASRLNEMLGEDSELKSILYETVPGERWFDLEDVRSED
jgi:hypothetical protein